MLGRVCRARSGWRPSSLRGGGAPRCRGNSRAFPAPILCQSHHVPERARDAAAGSAARSGQTWPPPGPASSRRASHPRPLPASPAEQVGSLCPLPLLPVPLTRGPLSRAATGCSSAGPKGGVRTRRAGGRSTRQGPPLRAMPLGASLDAKQICCCCRRFRNHVRHKGQELCRPGVPLFHRIRIVFYRHVIL